jgi:hypothetical protein
MKPDALRKHALSLPGAHEEPHFARTSFRVGKKIFATMTADGEEAMVRVTPPPRLEALLAGMPEFFFDHGAWTWKGGALGVRLAKVDPGLMRELVTDAWKLIAPKGGGAKLAGSPGRRTVERRTRRRPAR